MKLVNLVPILTVSDVPASLEWFERLGWRRGFTYNPGGLIKSAASRNEAGPAEFAGVCNGDYEIFLCHDGQGSRGGPEPRHAGEWVGGPAEVDAVHEHALALGIEVTWPPTDEPWGVRECHLVHPDGHTFRVSASLVEE
jgi:catechol 2,3-dioxygenase-like lactoylglutathione lyase family enzyme